MMLRFFWLGGWQDGTSGIGKSGRTGLRGLEERKDELGFVCGV